MKSTILTLIVVFFTATAVLGAETLPRQGLCAHRGENGVFPENTVSGFQEAVRLGAPQIEFDVQATKDGHLVLMHDATVDRTTDGQGKVADLTFEQIRSFDAGIKKSARFAGTKIPTFEEVLDVIPKGIWINVHIAQVNEATARAVAKVIADKNRTDQAFLACSRKNALAAKEVCPTILICNMERQGGDVSRYIRETIEWKCDFIQLLKMGTPEEMQALRNAGVRINYFPTPNVERFRELVKAGVDFPLVDDMSKFLDIAKEVF